MSTPGALAAFHHIRYTATPPLALIIIDREQQDNNLNAAAVAELIQAFQLAQESNDVRVVLLTGSGTHAFATGVDLTEIVDLSPQQARDYVLQGQQLTQQIEQLGKPVIALINGLAAGAGLELALACTIRLASDNARFTMSALKQGLIPAWGGSQRLTRLIGFGRALELILTGDVVDAEAAVRLGLVNQIYSQQTLFSEARELAQKISNQAPLAIKYCLDALFNGLEMPIEDSLFLEATLFGLCCATEDMREGVAAFLAHRAAQFQGK